jgi:hypothetical protein
MLPLAGTTCLVYGCGAIASEVSECIAPCTTRRLIVAVNGAAEAHGIAPDVIFHIDPGDWASGHPEALEVRSASVSGDGVALPMWRVACLPAWTNPGRLYHLPNTAAVAAIWAVSVGCGLIGLVGCGCEPDGRAEHQMRAMRDARDEMLQAYHDVRKIDTLGEWLAFKRRAVGMERILDDPVKRLRTFYT